MTRIFETPLYPYERSRDQDAAAPVRHPVIVVGAGPIGLAAAIDLALSGVPVVVLDENDRVSVGSRAICIAKRPLEILDRLGCDDSLRRQGRGVEHGQGLLRPPARSISFDLLARGRPQAARPLSICSNTTSRLYLVDRLLALRAGGESRLNCAAANKVLSVDAAGRWGRRSGPRRPKEPYTPRKPTG